MKKTERVTLRVAGMTCASCERRIETALGKLPGVESAKASMAAGRVDVVFDPELVDSSAFKASIEGAGYTVGSAGSKGYGAIGIGVVLIALYLLVSASGGFAFLPRIDSSLSLGMLFVAGLLTSLHCVAMCGGISISQSVGKAAGRETGGLDGGKPEADGAHAVAAAEVSGSKRGPATLDRLLPGLLYNGGRVVSYTIIGGLVGAVGSVFSFSPVGKAMLSAFAGLFMVALGLKMLGIFPWLSVIRLPRLGFLGRSLEGRKSPRGPFVVGLLNGLMPCGPLQTMQLYALGTGSALTGALAMFLFSLGTVPLMASFGFLSALMTRKFAAGMVKASSILVMFLGIVMMGRAADLSGLALPSMAALRLPGSGQTLASGTRAGGINLARLDGGVQYVTTDLARGYTPFTVQKGVPVKWNVKARAEDITGCNGTLTVPAYGVRKTLRPGDNLIEFTPDRDGPITYTCWMGMITSRISVVPDLGAVGGTAASSAGRAGDSAGALSAKDALEAGSGQNADGTGTSAAGAQGAGNLASSPPSGGGCCSSAALAPGFANGRIPTDDIRLAVMKAGVQEVTIKVTNQGYSPAAVVLQKGVKARIRFEPAQLNSCNSVVVFPEYGGQLNLGAGQLETPSLEISRDFTIRCSMNMLHGYFKVVDDLSKVDLSKVKREIAAYKPAAGGGGCCSQ